MFLREQSRKKLRGTYILTDETPVDVQMHDGRGRNRQAYLWQYGTPGGGAVFDFKLGRGRNTCEFPASGSSRKSFAPNDVTVDNLW